MPITRTLTRLVVGALIVFTLAPALADTDRGIAYRIGGASPSYLLGSVHVGKASMYPLPGPIMQAYDRTDALVVEADIVGADMTQVAGLVAERGMYGSGRDLKSALSASAWRDVSKAAERYGLPVSMLKPQKPWLATQTLTVIAMQAQGYSEQWGVDRHFLELAHEDGKRIAELEGLEAQLEMLAGMPEAEQQALLSHTAAQMVDGELPVAELLAAWRSGQPQSLQAQVQAQFPPELEGVYESLIVARNRTMAGRIEALLEEGGSVFVVVGAAHLTGESGLVALLRERGYELEQL